MFSITMPYLTKLIIALRWIALFRATDAVFVDIPADAVVLSGSPAVFNCSTNSTNPNGYGSFISWYGCNSLTQTCTTIYMDLSNTTLSSGYQVTPIDSTNGVHSRNLRVITSSAVLTRTPVRGAKVVGDNSYVCNDLNSYASATAQLAVIAGQPSCTTNATSPTSPNDIVFLLCRVDISGITQLNASLTQGVQKIATGNSRTVSWTGSALYVVTDNVTCVAPAGITSVQCPTVQVKPGNIAVNEVKSEYIANDTLYCSAVGSSPLSYQWTTNTTVSIAPGPVLVVNKNMAGPVLLQCTVTNNYGNTTTSIEAVVAGTAPPSTTTTITHSSEYSSTSRDAAIAVGVIAIVSIAIIIVLVVYIGWKSTNNGKQDQTRSKTSTETNLTDNTSTYQGMYADTIDPEAPKLYESIYAN